MSRPQPATVADASPRARKPDGRRSPGGDGPGAGGSRQRAEAIALRRLQGHSLDEIALSFDVSRERVRQILRAHGGPDAQHVADARRRRAEQQAQACIEELLELWRAGAAPRSAARTLDLQPAACRDAIARCATDLDRAARKATLARARTAARTYSDRDIAAALTSVAVSLGHVPRQKEYEAIASTYGWPSLATVVNRMGGWTNAVKAAGLTPAWTPARTRSRRWTADACWTAVRRVVAELERIPTVAMYDRHAADRPDLPSSATLRHRLGRWSTITTQLLAEHPNARPGRDEPPTRHHVDPAEPDGELLTAPGGIGPTPQPHDRGRLRG